MSPLPGRISKFLQTALLALAASALACAAPAIAAPVEEPVAAPAPPLDPLEPVNRVLFGIDRTANRLLAGKGRVLTAPAWIPAPVKAGVFNVFQNLQEPATFANDLFQRKAGRAVTTTGRFAVNSTVGVFGIFDVASKLGLERTREDFGQTLAVYGVSAGPYLFLPFSGPTSVRDTAAGWVDGHFSPLGWVDMTSMKRRAINVTRHTLHPSTLNIRQEARTAAAHHETKDEYAMVRELYLAQREAQIHDEPNLADHPVLMTPRNKTASPKASAEVR